MTLDKLRVVVGEVKKRMKNMRDSDFAPTLL